ncbi:hypothetical protein N7486_003532 [Penicillium sp. IBT 16267x]|nr:hypothetical protein N7486_003532 [Penicillium sp. IBT 16267x]
MIQSDQFEKPTIAVTIGYQTDPRPYGCAMAAAGGVHIFFLLGPKKVCLGPEVRGVVLTGGASVHPRRYGQEFDPSIKSSVDEARDHLEFSVVQLTLERNLPILGICRGLQLINVFFGGTLHQNLVGAGLGLENVHRPDKGRDHLAHEIIPLSGSLKNILGPDKYLINSIYRQGVAKLGTGLCATVKAEDGVIEGLESMDRAVMAIQWHPKELFESQQQSSALFLDLVCKSRDRIKMIS